MKLKFPFGSNQDSYTSRCLLLLSDKYIWLCIFWFLYETLIAHCTEGLIDVACDHCYLHIFHSSNPSVHNSWVYCRVQGEPFHPEGASTEYHSAPFCQSEGSIFLFTQDLPKLEQGEEFSRITERKLASRGKLEMYKTATYRSCMCPSKRVYIVGWCCTLQAVIFTGVKLGRTQGACLGFQPTPVTPAVTRDLSPTLLKLCVLANQAALQGTQHPVPTCWQKDLCLSLESTLEWQLLTVLGWQQRPGILLKYLSALPLLKDLI